MIVTTAGRTNNEMIQKAKKVAGDLGKEYIERRKKTVKGMKDRYSQDILVVGKERLELFSADSDEPFFFHPNSASFRLKRILNGEEDSFAEAAGLTSGMSLLDCTLGMASDSIVASFAVGSSGKVTGIEGSLEISYLIREGLKTWDSGLKEMNEAMKRVEVVNSSSIEYLKEMPDNSFDVVYFDPMFSEPIVSSAGIMPMRNWALYSGLDKETIEQAKRVANRRVVLKEHFNSPLFAQFGFQVNKRPSAKFHYGIIEL
ncbi:class I SAM-dependent methyltransferase [Bacillus sp. AK031]